MTQTTVSGLPTIGDVILAWRKFRGLRSTELVKKAGIKKGYLSAVEHNKRANPQEEYLVKLADALDVPLQDIYGRRMPPQNSVVGTTPSAAQPAVVRPTQKAARALHFPKPRRMEQERVIQELQAVLSKAEESQERWQETLELLESFVEWLKFRLEEPLSFAKRLYLQIIGPASEVQSIFDEVEARKHPNLKVASAPREYKSMFKRHKYGYKARLCGTVEFTGHVSEKLAHDYIKSLIGKKFPQSRIEVKVSENIENL